MARNFVQSVCHCFHQQMALECTTPVEFVQWYCHWLSKWRYRDHCVTWVLKQNVPNFLSVSVIRPCFRVLVCVLLCVLAPLCVRSLYGTMNIFAQYDNYLCQFLHKTPTRWHGNLKGLSHETVGVKSPKIFGEKHKFQPNPSRWIVP